MRQLGTVRLAPGATLAGYRIEQELGEGGMGVVYRATQIALDRPVALKLIAPELAADDAFRERFRREAKLAASIEHPNVLPVHEAGEIDGTLFVAARFVDGRDASELVREGPVAPTRALPLVRDVASALDAAHARGLVHRDVKPHNVLIERRGERESAYLTDFGLAKGSAGTSGLTATGTLLGTVDYAAPEVIRGESVDGRADVYSLGCVLFELLSGDVPFCRDHDVARLWAHVHDPPPSLSERRLGLPPAIDAVIARALEKGADDRFASAGELADAAARALAGFVVEARAPSPQRVPRAAPRGERPLPTGTVTLLATDVEGSTQLLAEIGAEAYAEALAEHRRALREAFAAHEGVEVDTQGDAFLVAFSRASNALSAADAAQRALADGPIRVRMGLHSGEPLLTHEGYVGIDVHQAARVMSAGHGGQILLSHATKALVEDSAPIRNLGSHRLKDLTAPQPLYQLGDAEFPPVKALHQTNLPVQPTPLVGRETELADVSRLLHESRLVTLTGAGGSGKTRLALQAVAEAVDEFEHGVWWVSLAPVRDPELVEPTIAQAVGAKDRLCDWARGVKTLLLLDNCEHLLDGVASAVSELAEAADVRVLATSRERLGIAAEQEYPVPTLTPDDAVALFVARARRSTPAFQPDEHVATICERLDGLPLAVELAAARITVLSPDRILERLGRSLGLLTAGARDAPERQRTLRATVEWSHNLLAVEEQQLFARMAVFAGGCTLEAAEQVLQADLDTLQSLVEKSLLRRTEARYWMLETIREYAEERLSAMKDGDAWRARHVEHFVAFAEDAQVAMKTAEQERWLELFSDEKANFRSALDWAGEHDPTLALRMCSALAWFGHHGSDVQEWRRRLEFALERARDASPDLLASALDGACIVAHACGEFAAERRYASQQLRLAEKLQDSATRARALSNLAIAIAAGDADLDRALELLRESVELARTVSNTWVLTLSTLNLGWVALSNGDYEFAIEALEESLALSRAQGDRVIRMHILFNLGQAQLRAGDPQRAGLIFDECMRMSRDVDFADGLVYCLVGLAGVALRAGAAERSARLLGAAEAHRAELGIAFEPGDQELFDDVAASVTRLLGAEAAEAESRIGRDMRLEEAVDYALSLA